MLTKKGFLEGFLEGSCYGFRVNRGSEKGSQKGFLERGFPEGSHNALSESTTPQECALTK